MPFDPDEFFIPRPIVCDIAFVGPVDLHPDPLSKPIAGCLNLHGFQIIFDRNNPLKWIDPLGPSLFVSNQVEDLFPMGR